MKQPHTFTSTVSNISSRASGEYGLELEVIAGRNLAIPSNRMPAGLYVLVSTPCGQWNTAIKAAMADYSVSWNETLIIRGRPRYFIPFFSRAIRFEIRASFECEPILGRGELVGTLETTLQELLAHKQSPFEISPASAVNNQCPSLVLKARRTNIAQRPVGSTVQYSHINSEIGRATDVARDLYALFWKSNIPSDLDYAIRAFQAVLEKCPHGSPEHAAALSNLAYAILCGCTKNIPTDIDHAISLFRSALEFCPREHPDHPLYIFNLCRALQKRYIMDQKDHAVLHEAVELYHSLLPLCAEGSYIYRVALENTGVLYVIEQCNTLPRDPSNESVSLRRTVLELCPPQHQQRACSLYMLAGDLYACFEQTGNVDHLYEAVHLSRELAVPYPADDHLDFLITLSNALKLRFDHHSNPSDLYESISLEVIHREALDLRSRSSSSSSQPSDYRHSGAFSEAAHRDLGLTSIPGPEHGQPAPPVLNVSLNNKTRSRARNVVIFGESGSGKSSVINAIAQKQLAKTSVDATGCTFRHQSYKVNISGQEYALFDTVGFDEGTEGTVPAAQAKKGLNGLLAKLTSPVSDGIDLLVYCVQSTRARHALLRHYNHVYSTICRKKVPIVVVVTGLEDEPIMENWWNTYGQEFESFGMLFKDHACVTTLVEDPGTPVDFIHRIAESRKVLRNLIVKNCSE